MDVMLNIAAESGFHRFYCILKGVCANREHPCSTTSPPLVGRDFRQSFEMEPLQFVSPDAAAVCTTTLP